ncbi:hypothetical protein A4A71_02980 [Nicoletella semolina]|nr:hypothetical protein [Nicoletella semolina]MDH2924333.1 hypothetical protein [Nicoletella semolina]
MKSLFNTTVVAFIFFILTGCVNDSSGWKRLPDSQVDQKSYAIGYSTTAQTYLERVNETYDIQAFIRGSNDWLNQKIALPVEQIRASLLNRMLDHPVYAYYSGVLYAAELQNNFNRLSQNCWHFVQSASLIQGIWDAMYDIRKNSVRDDQYIQQGADQFLHLCVLQLESEQKAK